MGWPYVGSALMLDMLMLAVDAARLDADRKRRAYVGAVGLRPDGAVVRSRNGSAVKVSPHAHAEARLLRKCGAGSQVFVARVLKSGETAMARPCSRCRAALRARGITFVTYTTGQGSYRSEKLG